MQHLQSNTTLQGGKYRIERVLGQGGFGNTYVGINTTFEDRVAIKEFFMQGINDRDGATGSITISIERNKQQFQEQLEKFKKEALRIRKLDNPHIVRVHDLFEENGTAYYVMDYIDGESLAEKMKKTGQPMSESEVREILPQILDALKSVHDAGIWHLDLKPANIMLDKSGNVKLIDFGASKQLNAQKGGATTSTAISYTNGYAPREQMEQNYDKFGPWTDIYALGATLYNLLTNKRPPLPSDIDDDETEDKHEALPFLDSTSVDMRQLVLRMLNTNRNKRPQSIDEIKVFLSNNSIGKQNDKIEPYEYQDEEKTIIANNNSIDEETVIAENKEKDVVEDIETEFSFEDDEEDNNDRVKKILLIIALAAIVIIGFISIRNCNGNETHQEAIDTDSLVVDSMIADNVTEGVPSKQEKEKNDIREIKENKIQSNKKEETTSTPTKEASNNKIYDVVEQMPTFPGGPEALFKYLSENIKYPVVAEENGIQGRVIVTYVVEKDGSISDVRVVKSVDPSLDKEAQRVVKSMPRWIPGKQNGSAVRVKYTVPVTFRLQ